MIFHFYYNLPFYWHPVYHDDRHFSSKEFQNINLAPAKIGGSIFHGKRIANQRRREPERGLGARVTGLRPYGEARHPHRARRSEPGNPSKSAGAFTTSCVRNSGSSSPAGRRIWGDNGQGGGIVTAALL